MDFGASFTVGNFVLVAFTAIVVALAMRWVVKPYLKQSNMKNALQGKYKFNSYPFRPYGFSFVQTIINDFKKRGDSFYTRKHQFSSMDLSIGTIRIHLFVSLINHKLVHEFSERQKDGFYKKNGGIHFESFKQLLGDGLLLSEAEEWRYKRRIMSSLFNYEFIKSKFSMIVSIAKEICQEAKASKLKDGKCLIVVNQLFQKIFGTVVIRCFFGDIKLDPIQGKDPFYFLSGLVQKIAERNLRISSFLFGRFCMKYGIRKIDREINAQIKLFRDYTKDMIDQIIKFVQDNTAEKDSQGLIAKLRRQKKLVKDCSYQEKIKKGFYTYEDLVNEITTFFFAGTDTTSNSMSSLIHQLIESKQVEQKLRLEIKQVINDDIGNINLQNLKKMQYLRYVQSQILRFLPSVPHIFPREALQDHKIGEINIRKGTLVTADLVSHHYDPKVFQKPLEFKPERWEKLENTPMISQEFYPFSFGQRTCIGQQLALIESKVALVIFLLNFKNGSEVEPPRHKFSLTYGPEKSLIKFEAI